MIILDVSSKRHTYDLPMAWLKGTKESAVARETMDSFRWAARQEQFEKQQQELQQQQQEEEDNTLQQLKDEETPKQQEDDEFHRILYSSSDSNNHSSFSSSRRILMKRVQFRDLSEHDVNAKDDEEKTPQLCPEECQELWYSKSEIHALRKDMERELRQYKTRRNSANAANTSIACFRGLEEVCSLRAHMDKKARKAAALRVLLQEQARQLESGCVNADTLAKRCARASTASKELALQLAQQDEAEAREIWEAMDQTIGEDKVEARTETKDLNKTKQNPHEEEEDTTVTTASLSLEEEEPPFSHQATLSPFFPKSPRPKVKPKFNKRGLQSRSVFYPPSPLSRTPNQCTNVAIGSSDTNEPDLQQKPSSSSLRHIEYRHHSHHYDDNNNKDHHVKSPLHRSSSDVMSKQRHFIDYSKSNRSQSSLRLERGTDAPPVLPPPLASATKTEDKEPKEEKVENHDVLDEDDAQQQRRRIVATDAKSPSRRRCISPPVKTTTTRTRRRSKSPGNALKNKDEVTGNRRRHVLRLEPSRSSSAIVTRPNGDSWWISPSSLSSSSSSSEKTDGEKSQKAQPREEEKDTPATTATEDDKAMPLSSSKVSSASTRKVIKVRGQLPVGCSSPSIFSSPNSPFASSRKIKARLVSSKNSDHKKTNQDINNIDDSNDNHIDKTSSSHRNNSAHADTPTSPSTPRNRGRSPARVSSATSPRRHRARRPVSPGVTYQPPLPLKSPSFNDGIQKVPESPKSPHKTKLSINRATKQMVIEAIEG